jgi:hypothetical protein
VSDNHGVITRARCVAALAAVTAVVVGCGGSPSGSSGRSQALSSRAGHHQPESGLALLPSSYGPTTCTVYGPGDGTQIVFESSRLDVRAECLIWSANRQGVGYLWGYERAAIPDATRLCTLTDPGRTLIATVLQASEYLPITAAQRAKGLSTCERIIASGWIRRPR